MTSDSDNLHRVMVRMIKHRGQYPSVPTVAGIISAIGDLQHGIELGVGNEAVRDRAIELSAVALRLAGEFETKQSPGLPVAKPTSETPRLSVP
jgi:hypothetical protein